MSLPQRTIPFDADAYLAWEREQQIRHEYVNGETFAMSGATDAHVTVALNLASLLRAHLRGTRCRVYMADMKLRVEAANAFFYPDVMVTCAEADRQRQQYKTEPTLLVEVLSPNTSAYDRGAKFGDYRRLASLQEYVLIDPTQLSVDIFRKNQDGRFELYPVAAEEVVELTSVDAKVSMAELYEDVSFDAEVSDLIEGPSQGISASSSAPRRRA